MFPAISVNKECCLPMPSATAASPMGRAPCGQFKMKRNRIVRKLVHQAQLLWRTVWSVLKKKKKTTTTTESYHMIPQSHPWAYIQKIRQLCSPMATAALFTRVKIQKQPNCPSIAIFTLEQTEAL